MEKINVLVIGSGGREHAIVKSIKKSPLCARLVCAPGNGGISEDCEVKDIAVESVAELSDYACSENFNLVIVGPEIPLSLGLANELRSRGIAVYGPNKDGATLEASKAFSKDFMKKYSVPTAEYQNFKNFAAAKEFIKKAPFDVVIKASGLAAGKGVIIPSTKEEAVEAAREMLEGGCFGASGSEIVVEEKMEGEESSIMLMVCGTDYVMLPPSQDHKRVGDGDSGPNTGGMGAYAPAAVATDEVLADVRKNIIAPVLAGLVSEGIDYRGTLYVGIMITRQGPKVVEFNVRFGDPECQVLMPLIESDSLELIRDIAEGKLDSSKVKIKDEFAAVVVVCAKGYPDAYPKGDVISFPPSVAKDSYIIHSGTKRLPNGDIVTNGGRVLGMTATAKTLKEALEKAYVLCDSVKFEGAFFRRDIGYRQLARDKK